MRVMQYKILNQVLENFEIPEYIWGFERGKSIPEMAKIHVGKTIVISLDIEDFFTSIHESGIRAILIESGIEEAPARSLSELMTYTHFVPQGALTSPKISNIVVAATFGEEVKVFCENVGLTLSIFADDITVSTDKVFETREEQKEFIQDAVVEISKSIRKYGFSINHKKTKVMFPHQRMWVTGCVTNVKVSLRKTERQRLRAIVHNTEKNGLEEEASKMELTPQKFASVVTGRLNWYEQLDPRLGGPLKEKFKTLVKQEKSIDADLVFASVDSLYAG